MKNAATTGTEEAELAEAARIADASGDVSVQLDVAADKALDLIASGDVTAGLAGLAEASELAVATGTSVGAPWLPLCFSDSLPVAAAARPVHRGVPGRP